MPFDITKLHRAFSGPIPGILTYEAGADAIAAVVASGYFNAASSMLRKADIILVSSASQAAVDLILVTSATGAATVTTTATEGSAA
jgi:hypothetical protein